LLWAIDAESGLAATSSEAIREHVRFTTVRLERPAEPARLVAVLEAAAAERLVAFGSGGRGFDLLDWLPPHWRSLVLEQNAGALHWRESGARAVLT
jgi:hypothetical protein